MSASKTTTVDPKDKNFLTEAEAKSLLKAARDSRYGVRDHLLLLRMVGRCALESKAQSFGELGLPYHAVGYLAQGRTTFAQAWPPDLPTGTRLVVRLADEIFAAEKVLCLKSQDCAWQLLSTLGLL